MEYILIVRHHRIAVNAKSVCQSSLYGINMKHKNIGTFDWHKLTKNTTFTLNLTAETYHKIFRHDATQNENSWNDRSAFLTLPSSVPQPAKRIRTRSHTDGPADILEYIKEGQFAGRSYCELMVFDWLTLIG